MRPKIYPVADFGLLTVRIKWEHWFHFVKRSSTKMSGFVQAFAKLEAVGIFWIISIPAVTINHPSCFVVSSENGGCG